VTFQQESGALLVSVVWISRKIPLEASCEIHSDENGDVFVLVGGVKIAKRGCPARRMPNTWIMLEPGWMVRDVKGGTAIDSLPAGFPV
jgi:hypothetical protein